ncbi:MAG: CDP-alcohol phosphatidyltransferase family protein [Nitrospinae bacterium]|nr:CDP-alcohol phosphatidyltransferase family protein [Nitrospinota bacterium]MDA1109515.1 CDP-alcohol phosphatidyltransferase family protein [Nitrospinota bacterium]
MHKLPPDDRFFDLNEVWCFFNRRVIRVLYPLPVTANQITFLSLLMGLLAAGFYLSDFKYGLIWAAAFLYVKIFLDNVDGNLARIRGEVSRLGRFFDSLTDFVVTFAVYAAITFRLVQETQDPFFWTLGIFSLLSGLLHCSYFVFYLVNYTSMVGAYKMNRVREDITDEDRQADSRGESPDPGLGMQRLHVWLYGWQDRSVEMLDGVSQKLAEVTKKAGDQKNWYLDKRFLAWVSPLCLCTNNMILVVFSLLDRLETGLWVVLILGNAYLLAIQFWKIRHHPFKTS